QVVQAAGIMQQQKLAPGRTPDGAETRNVFVREQPGRRCVLERADHPSLRYSLWGNRARSMSQYLAAVGSSSAGNNEIALAALSVTTISSSMRAPEYPSVAGQ